MKKITILSALKKELRIWDSTAKRYPARREFSLSADKVKDKLRALGYLGDD